MILSWVCRKFLPSVETVNCNNLDAESEVGSLIPGSLPGEEAACATIMGKLCSSTRRRAWPAAPYLETKNSEVT